ncbi:hypothetical protein, partial [Teichococcus cervicalis]
AVLAALEARARGLEPLAEELPLFGGRPAESPESAQPAVEQDALRDALDAIDPDRMTPREALEALYRLKLLHGSNGAHKSDHEAVAPGAGGITSVE